VSRGTHCDSSPRSAFDREYIRRLSSQILTFLSGHLQWRETTPEINIEALARAGRRPKFKYKTGPFPETEANMKDTGAIVGAMLPAAFLLSPVSGIGQPDNSDNRNELGRAPE